MTKATFVLALLPTNGIIIYIFVPQFSQEISTLLQKSILLCWNFTPFSIFFEAFNETKHHFVLCRLNCETCIHTAPGTSMQRQIKNHLSDDIYTCSSILHIGAYKWTWGIKTTRTRRWRQKHNIFVKAPEKLHVISTHCLQQFLHYFIEK